ncbi:hypothetical protein [Tsukamurella paurometabola]|uniref:Uncharacterized protein n=1 Tax=Tsukamurella paurometabola TaxID=2061 RepID=A0ABS5NDU6_TSUPA|nr:hypothetical protein [Tsukamurella paurometabola]MBS4102435.1 hypothetical protein [Tsukamurella paurometabola]
MNEFEDYDAHLRLIRAAALAHRYGNGDMALELIPALLGHLTYWRSVAHSAAPLTAGRG